MHVTDYKGVGDWAVNRCGPDLGILKEWLYYKMNFTIQIRPSDGFTYYDGLFDQLKQTSLVWVGRA